MPKQADDKTAAIYTRFSTEEQGEGAYSSIDAQKDYLRSYASAHGFQIVADFSDEAKTGTNLRRAGYRSLLQAAREKQIRTVLVTRMDRLARGKAFTIAEYELAQAGVVVITALQEFGAGAAGYISQSARQMIDGVYPVLVREMTEAHMIKMLAQGFHCAGPAPFGYELTEIAVPVLREGKRPPKRLTAHPVNADIVREAYRLAADTGSQAAVRRYLIAATDSDWAWTRVTRLLSSLVYRGVATWGVNHRNEAAHLPLIDQELWDEVQETIGGDEAKATRVFESGCANYYLRGLVRCTCGRRMTSYWTRGRNGRQYRYYQCTGRKNNTCTGIGMVSADSLHSAVFVQSSDVLRSSWRLRNVLQEARALLPDTSEVSADRKRLRREVARLQREKDRFVAAIRVSPSSVLGTLTVQLGAVESELAAARVAEQSAASDLADSARFVPCVEQMQAVLGDLGSVWAVATDEERGRIARELVRGVSISSEKSILVDFNFEFGKTSPVRDSRGEFSAVTTFKGPSRPKAQNVGTPKPASIPLPMGKDRGQIARSG